MSLISTFDESVGGGTGDLAHLMNLAKAVNAASTGHNASVPVNGSGATDASGNLLMDLGQVPMGRTWRLRQLVVGGTSFATTASGSVAGTALLLITPSVIQTTPQADVTPPMNTIRDYSSALPNKAFYDAGQAVAKGGEHIYLYIINSAAAQGVPYLASGRVDDVPADWPVAS